MDRLRAQNEELTETMPADELLTQYFIAQDWLKKTQTPADQAEAEKALTEWEPSIPEKWD